MKLGLDIDGTISANPAFFAFLARAWVAAGGEVHIVTARHVGHHGITVAHLIGWGFEGIPYTLHLYPHQYNYLDHEEAVAHYQAHAGWKASVCRKHGIDILIDDDHRNLVAVREAGIYSLSAGFVLPEVTA